MSSDNVELTLSGIPAVDDEVERTSTNSKGFNRTRAIIIGVIVVAAIIVIPIGIYYGISKSNSSSNNSAVTPLDVAFDKWKSFYAPARPDITLEKEPTQAWLDHYNSALKTHPEIVSNEEEFLRWVNVFADMDSTQYDNLMGFNSTGNTGDIPNFDDSVNGIKESGYNTGSAPASFTWVGTTYASSPIKNQGTNCGACWAFAAAQALESAYGLYTGKTIKPLSAQQIVSCDAPGATGYSSEPSNNNDIGCGGGDPAVALQYYLANNALSTATAYPYKDGSKGTASACSSVAGTGAGAVQGTGMYWVNQQTTASWSLTIENTVISALYKYGPVVAQVDASNWPNYVSGTLVTPSSGLPSGISLSGLSSGITCSAASVSSLTHSIMIVGYTANYWIIKNQWGTSWGNKGYIYISRGANTCCILCYTLIGKVSGTPALSGSGSSARAPSSTKQSGTPTCSALTSCVTCAQSSLGCGWTSAGTCVAGTASGSTTGGYTGSSWTWFDYNCNALSTADPVVPLCSVPPDPNMQYGDACIIPSAGLSTWRTSTAGVQVLANYYFPGQNILSGTCSNSQCIVQGTNNLGSRSDAGNSGTHYYYIGCYTGTSSTYKSTTAIAGWDWLGPTTNTASGAGTRSTTSPFLPIYVSGALSDSNACPGRCLGAQPADCVDLNGLQYSGNPYSCKVLPWVGSNGAAGVTSNLRCEYALNSAGQPLTVGGTPAATPSW